MYFEKSKVGYSRNKLLFRKALQNLKSFLWMLDYVWDGSLALDLWDMVNEVLHSTNNNVQPKHTSIQKTGATHPQTRP